MEFDSKKFYLGVLCKRAHDYEGTGQSLRRNRWDVCVECQRISRQSYYRRNRERYMEQARAWQKANPDKVALYRERLEAKEETRERKKKYCKENWKKYYLTKQILQEKISKLRKENNSLKKKLRQREYYLAKKALQEKLTKLQEDNTVLKKELLGGECS